MSTLQKEVFQMIFSLPEKSLKSLKPLLDELLSNAVLSADPTANVSQMDEYDKILFLRNINGTENAEYVSFEEALAECGVARSEL
ncbi:MAG: hypothetical protein FWB93_05830 [Oscillospiraceae bacterium]|nr:hypothetical protein [Oscillospiraceae bacterium]